MKVVGRAAIVVAHYEQPGYAVESIASAWSTGSQVVVVDDCSSPSTQQTLRGICASYPERLVLLQHPENGGLGAARNTGISWVLRHRPEVEWILPLDSDDVIESSSIERLIGRWDAEDQHLGWLYGDATLFGTFEVMSRVPRRFTTSRLLRGNYCFATSFLHRKLFDAGLRYDPTLRSGLEDWDLYLQALELGFHGRHAGHFGFHYRKHGTSMLSETNSQLAAVEQHVRDRHPALFDRANVLEVEHAELPRFALVDLDRAEVRLMSSPDRPATVIRLVDDGLPDLDYWPPLVVAARGAWFDQIAADRMLHQVLATVQAGMAHQSSMSLGWHVRHAGTRGLLNTPEEGTLAGVAFDATRACIAPSALLDIVDGRLLPPAQTQYGPVVPHQPRLEPVAHRGAVEAVMAVLMRPPVHDIAVEIDDHVYGLDREFVIHEAVTLPHRLELRVPDPAITDIGVVLPWAGLGGMDLIMLELAAAYAAQPDTRVHLMTTEGGLLEIADRYAEVFTTINPVAATSHNERTVHAFMEEMDVLLVANSPKVYSLLPLVRQRTAPAVHVFIQNVDIAPDGVSVGYLFPLARQYDKQVDGYFVPSALSKSMIEAFGVDPAKVHVTPNAAVYRPADEPDFDAPDGPLDRPLRVLYAGRFDRQKGMDRLLAVFDALRSAAVPFEARLVGKTVLAEDEHFGASDITIVPPSFEIDDMRPHFEWADVLVLPSRWEGLPLVMLDAMGFGLVVITTDVGGIPEYVSDGVEAVVVSDAAGDAHVVRRFVDTLRRVHAEPAAFVELRRAAYDFSSAISWSGIADDVARHFPRRKQT